jgi:hypothetical protein
VTVCLLVLYGPETQEVCDTLRQAVVDVHQKVWPASSSQPANLDPSAQCSECSTAACSDPIVDVRADEWLHRVGDADGTGLLGVVLLLGFGSLARFQITIAVALIVGALSVSSAVFLIMALNTPYQGLLRLPDTAFRSVLGHIDR